MLEAVFFDLGKVLVDFDLEKAFLRVKARTHLDPAQIRSAVISPRIYEFEKGLISPDEFFGALRHDLEFQGTVAELQDIFDDIFTEMAHNVEAVRALRGRVRLGIISNTNISHVTFVEKNFTFLDLFDTRIYSHEVQLRKPDLQIYRRALASLGVSAERSLFIDDLEANVRGAREAGMEALHLPPGTHLGPASHPGLKDLLKGL